MAVNSSDNFSIYENYVSFLYYYDSPENAVEFIQKDAVIRFPKSPKIWKILGMGLYKIGKKQQAIEALETSINLFSDDEVVANLERVKKGLPLIQLKI